MNKEAKKILKNIILSLAIVVCLFSSAPEAMSAPSGTVSFEQTPLFNNANFIPGDAVTRWIKVVNNTLEEHQAVVRLTNVLDVNNLGGQIELVIKKGGAILYNGTFSDLFNKDKIKLSKVAAGDWAQFDFIATFKTTAGNNFQNKTLNFDLVVGFDDSADEGAQTQNNSSVASGGPLSTQRPNLNTETIYPLIPEPESQIGSTEENNLYFQNTNSETAEVNNQNNGPLLIVYDTRNQAGLGTSSPVVMAETPSGINTNQLANIIYGLESITKNKYFLSLMGSSIFLFFVFKRRKKRKS